MFLKFTTITFLFVLYQISDCTTVQQNYTNFSQIIDPETGSLNVKELLVTDSESPESDNPAFNISKITFEAVNHLIESKQAWQDLDHAERLHLSVNILELIRDLSAMRNIQQEYPTNETEFKPTTFSQLIVQSKLFKLGIDHFMEFNLDFIKVDLAFEALENSSFPIMEEVQNVSASVVLISRNLTSKLSSEHLIVNSKIITVVIEDQAEIEGLKEPYRFRFGAWHLKRLEFFDHPHCAFWNFNESDWSTHGCTYKTDQSSRSFSYCECNHMRSNFFTILVDISQQEGSILAKSILTYIFSGITCIFLGLSVYILVNYYEVCRGLFDKFEQEKLTRERNKISLVINVSIYLLLTHVFVMFGFNLSNRMLCNLNAIFLLFTVLATLSFMMLLAAHYVLVKYHLLNRFIDFKYFNLVGYAIPTITIVISLIGILVTETDDIFENSLAGDYFCWISSPKYPENIWIFIGPAIGLIILCLLFCLIAFVYDLFELESEKYQIESTSNDSNRENAESECSKFQIKSYLQLLNIVGLVFTFAIPWILYTLYVNEYFGHFAYFFIFFNAIQGILFLTTQYYFYRINRNEEEEQNNKIRNDYLF